LARGGQADIYEIDGSRILRVLRKSGPDEVQMLMNERTIMAALREHGVGVPEVFEVTEADGLPALAIERITGSSMMDRVLGNPLVMSHEVRELAKLHCEVLGNAAPGGLDDIKKRVNGLIDCSQYIDEDDRAFVRMLLAELPDGKALLHGDFHPGNILTGAGKYYIIDWSNVTTGYYLSDIAHTYLLLGDKPRLPGEGNFGYRFVKTSAVLFARMYLKEMKARLGFDMSEFGKWMVVRAADRTVHGQPSELLSKANFVKAYRALHEKGIAPALWYKRL
jgi:aminoglycoside phosphotransferase (APT) family kinase protein